MEVPTLQPSSNNPSLPAADLDSLIFDPKEYIRLHYATIDFSTYATREVAGMDDREHEADLAIKQLVQTHLPTFIECKDAMDALYEKEEELFVGDALDPTKVKFNDAVAFVSHSTETLIELFGRLQTVEQQDEALGKLMAVLSVPGILYRACGARVAQVVRTKDGDKKKKGAARQWGANNNLRELKHRLSVHRRTFTTTGPNGRLSSSSSSSSDSDADVDSAGNEDADDDEMLGPGESRVWWCGIELIRGNASSQLLGAAEGGGDGAGKVEFDSAVQSLRAAFRFLEEHHDMVSGASRNLPDDNDDDVDGEGGTKIVGNVGDVAPITGTSPASRRRPSSNEQQTRSLSVTNEALEDAGGALSPSGPQRRRRSRYDHQLFTFRFAHALLCSCLYLADALHSVVFATDVTDAVQLEHHLDLLLETSIVCVQLRHFCAVVREGIMQNRSTGQALQAVQQALLEKQDSNDRGEEDDEVSTAAGGGVDASEVATTRSGASYDASARGAQGIVPPRTNAQHKEEDECSSQEAATKAASRADDHQEHPVEAFFNALRHHHSKAMVMEAEKYVREGSRIALGCSSPRRHNPIAAALNQTLHDGGSFLFHNSAKVSTPPPPGNGSEIDGDNDQLLHTISLLPAIGGGGHAGAGGGLPAEDDDDEDLLTIAFLREHQPVNCLLDLSGEDENARAHGRSRTERNIHLGQQNGASSPSIEKATVPLRPMIRGSCAILLAHSLKVSRATGMDSIAGSSLDAFVPTPVFGFLESLARDLQHRLVAYWRGIGATIHNGAFDVPLGADTQPLSQAIKGRGVLKGSVPNGNTGSPLRGGDNAADDALPEVPMVRYVPLVSSATSAVSSHPPSVIVPLLGLSVHAVQRMVQSTTSIMARTIAAYGRHVCANGWLLSELLDAGDVDDSCAATSASPSVNVDVRCCVAVQVFLNHMESISTAVVASFSGMKLAVVETVKSDSISTDAQLTAVTDVLSAIEEGRDSVIRAVLFVSELLVKTFLLTDVTVACSKASTAGCLAPRLLRGCITTSIPVKCFNVFLLFTDRMRACFDRFDETTELPLHARQQQHPQKSIVSNDSSGGGAGESNASRPQRRGRRGRLGEAPQPPPPPPPAVAQERDPVLEAVADFNAQVVRRFLEGHLQLFEQAIANLLVLTIDVCHLRCHQENFPITTHTNPETTAAPGELHLEVECIADLLCAGNVLPRLVVDHILTSNVISLVSSQQPQSDDGAQQPVSNKKKSSATPSKSKVVPPAPSSPPPESILLWIRARKDAFVEQQCGMLQEMAFVAIESVFGRLVADAQADVTQLVVQHGFSKPGLDWSCLGPTDVRIRPFLIDCLLVAARVQEALSTIEVPALAFAAVLRIAACMGAAIVSSLQTGSPLSCFELTSVPTPSFYVYGIALLEAEARFCVNILHRLLNSCAPVLTLAASARVTSLGDAARVQLGAEEVTESISILSAVVRRLESIGTSACEQLGKGGGANVESVKQRGELVDGAVQRGLSSSRLVVDALSSFLDTAAMAVASSQSTGTQPNVPAVSFEERIQRARKVSMVADESVGEHVLNSLAAPTSLSRRSRHVKIRAPSDAADAHISGEGESEEGTGAKSEGGSVMSRLEASTRKTLRSQRLTRDGGISPASAPHPSGELPSSTAKKRSSVGSAVERKHNKVEAHGGVSESRGGTKAKKGERFRR